MSAPAALATDETLMVKSDLLGEFAVTPDQTVRFSTGIPGFPEARSWVLLATDREDVFWLQSTDFSPLTLLLVDPFRFFPAAYQIDLTEEDLARLGTRDASAILVLVVVTLGSGPQQPSTANLRAPVLFNLVDRSAFQSIRREDGLNTREVIDPQRLTPPR